MASEKGASKTDAVVKVVIVFFVCLLSFSIGTFVGKKFSDSQHKIAKFEPGESPSRDVASAHEDGEEVKAGETLSDSEVANLAAEFVSDESETESHVATGEKAEGHGEKSEEKAAGHHAEAPAKEVVHESAATPAHQETSMKASSKHEVATETASETPHEQPLAAAHHVAKNEAPTHEGANKVVAESKPRLPSSLPKDAAAATTGKYTVQVVAKKSEAEAKKYAAELKEKGFAAFYAKATVKSETWYRVNIGMYATAQEAESNKKELLSSGKITSAIVQKVLE